MARNEERSLIRKPALRSMALLTAVAAALVFASCEQPRPNGKVVPTSAAAAETGTTEPTGRGAQGTLAPPGNGELQCVAAPLEALNGIGQNEYATRMLSSGNQEYSGEIRPRDIDETLAKWGLHADLQNSSAASLLNEVKSSRNMLMLVVFNLSEYEFRADAVGLYLRSGSVQFRYTQYAPDKYLGFDETIGMKGFIIEIPYEVYNLPFSFSSIEWNEIPDNKRLEIMLNRIMTNPDVAKYLDSPNADNDNAPELFLDASPKQTAMGQEAADWLNERRREMQTTDRKDSMEFFVMLRLIEKIQAAEPAASGAD